MRPRVILTAVIILFCAGIFLTSGLLVMHLAKKNIRAVFKDSTVSISGCSVNPFSSLKFYGVSIKREPVYDIRIEKIKIHYSWPSVFKGVIKDVYLGNADFTLNLSNKNYATFMKLLNLGSKSAFSITAANVDNFKVNVKSADLSINAQASVKVDALKMLVDYADIKISSLDMQDLHLKNFLLFMRQGYDGGRLNITEAKYNKAVIRNTECRVSLRGKKLVLNPLAAGIFAGKLEGELSLLLDARPEYSLKLKALDLDLAVMAEDFAIRDKFELSGKITGPFVLEGGPENIDLLNGDLTAGKSGGALTIKDKNMLAAIAQNTGQSMDVIVESFRDYHYNTGKARLYLESGNLILEVNLEGEAGKRNFKVVVHDFKLKKEGL